MKTGSLCILTCASFTPESVTLAGEPDFEGVEFRPFPQHCGRPPLTWDAIRAALGTPDRCGAVRIFGGCCLASLGHPPPDLADCTITQLDNCFELVAGKETIAGLVSAGAYLVSSGWLAQWERHVSEWGFSVVTAREFFAECSSRIAVIDTGISEQLADDIAAFSAFIERPYVMLPTGLDLMRLRMLLAREQWRGKKARHAEQLAQRQFTEYAMAFDLLSTLIRSVDEGDVIRQTTNLYRMLFGASEVAFLAGAEALDADYRLLPAGDGFLLNMSHGAHTLGVIRIAGVALPEHLEVYLNLALTTIGVCGLALNNARAFREIADKNRALNEAHATLQSTHVQMLQQEKMASIGQLAAGVAHEINNPIGFITSNLCTLGRYMAKIEEYLEVVERCSAEPPPDATEERISARSRLKIDHVREDIGQLIKESLYGATRVKDIVKELMNLTQVNEAAAMRTDLNQCMQSALNIVGEAITSVAGVQLRFGKIPEISGHPLQLSQVFINLLTNASQSIEGQGNITVSSWSENGSVFVSVTDNGCGIAKEMQPRVFEPFFTTKDVGQGTGLGLSISYEIIRQHGGEITLRSEPGQGATFLVRLPT